MRDCSPPPCVTCQVSGVIYLILISILFCFCFYKVVKLVGGGLLSTGPTPSSFCDMWEQDFSQPALRTLLGVSHLQKSNNFQGSEHQQLAIPMENVMQCIFK